VGAGVLGPVFRALDPDRQQTVGIKLFRLDMTPEQAGALAAHLAELVDRLPPHEALVRPLAAGVEGSSAFLVMGYVAADSIDHRLRRKVPTPLDGAIPLLEQVAAGLDAAAAEGIYHGALHPRDVLVSTRGAACVTGVGIMQALEAAGWRPPFRRPYAAPERLAGRPWDRRADVFTLAVLAVELATGRRPLMPENASALQSVAGLDPERAAVVRAVFASALHEDPDARDASAARWVERLASALRGDRDAPAVAIVGLPAEAVATGPEMDLAEDPRLDEFRSESDEPAAAATMMPATVPASVAEETSSIDTPAAAAETWQDDRWHVPPDAGPAIDVAPDATTDVAPAPTIDLPEWREPEPHVEKTTDEEPSPLVEARPDAGWEARSDEEPVAMPLHPGGVHESEAGAQVESGGQELFPEPSVPSQEPYSGEPRAAFDEPPVPRPRRGMLIAAMLACLAVGIGVGYWLGGRGGPEPAADTAAGVPPAAGAPAGTAGSGDVVIGAPPRVAAPGSPARPGSSRDRATTAPPARGTAGAQDAPRGQVGSRGPQPRAPSAATRPSGATAAAGQRQAAGPARDGRMLVRSSPADAEVLVNGARRGRTPLALRELEYGRYRVTVSRDGYAPVEREVVVSPSAPAATLTIDLQRVDGTPEARAASEPGAQAGAAAPQAPAETGSLEIDSRPRGARAFIDDQPVGTTPLRVAGVRAGSHVIRIEQDGYRPWTGTASTAAGRVTRVSASLESTTRP
jgi:serine/threonine-protein kinase